MDQSNPTSHAVLRDEILADAERQAKRLLRKAEREAKAALDKATAESQQERSDKLAAATAQADRNRALIFATVPVEIRRMRAARVEQELERLQGLVRERLEQRAGFDYAETLAGLAIAAIERMEGEEFVLEFGEEDLPRAEALVAHIRKRLPRPQISVTASGEPAAISSGVIVRDPSGRQRWNNSLAARLDRMWPLLRSQLAQQLGLQEDATPSGEPS